MTEKNRSKEGQESLTDQSRDTTTSKRARSRRLVLKSIVTGGAATTVKTLPEKWTRPLTESVLLPAHAQVSQATLACHVNTVASAKSDDGSHTTALGFHQGSSPSDPLVSLPVSGGSSTTVDQFWDASDGSADSADSNDRTFDSWPVTLSGIGVTLDPAGAGNVHLALTPGGYFQLNSGASANATPNAGGSANFSAIIGQLNAAGGNATSTGNLELRFSAPGVSDCVINFTFVEDPPPT